MKVAVEASVQGREPAALNHVEYRFVFSFGFYFTSPKWTRTKLQFVFSALLMVFLCLPHVQEQYSCQRISHAILIANGLVPIVLCNENHHRHVRICILGNWYLKV